MRLRIDELAQRSGTTSRNIRAYQQRGLLPPPTLEGRTGYYDEEHLQRLQLIAELQQRGFSLEAIRHTLDAWSRGGDLAQLVGFQQVLAAPFVEEDPQRYPLSELLERFPEAAGDPGLLERAVELDLVRPTGDDDVLEAPSPMLVAAGAELVRAGVPLRAVLELVEAVERDVADVAERFVGIVTEHLVTPVTEGDTERDVGDVVSSLARLRPIALEVVRPFLARQMQRAVDRAAREAGLRAQRRVAGQDDAG